MSPGAPGSAAERHVAACLFWLTRRSVRLRRATGSGQQALWANGRCDPSLVRLSDNLCFRTLLAFGRSSLSDTARWYRKKNQACSFLWYGTWDAPALVPNWSSFIFVVVVVVSVERFLFSVSVFVGGHYWRALRGVPIRGLPTRGVRFCKKKKA